MNKILYTQNNFPVFQNIVYDSFKEAVDCPLGDIRLVQDKETGLIYNELFKPELVIYNSDYNNEQSISQEFKKHLSSVYKIINEYVGSRNIVEIGCGKGFFLEFLLSMGVDIRGMDPAYDGSNPLILKEYFNSELLNGAEGVILRHVLEHIQDPLSFLFDLKFSNGDKGVIYIEVPCFDWICSHGAWYDIFYEHVNYFRLIDLIEMFDNVITFGRLFGGQYIYIVANLKDLKIPVISKNSLLSNFDILSNGIAFDNYECFNSSDVVWGGASKGVIYSLMRMRNNNPIKFVIDINPAKHGKHLPVTGLCVLNPEIAFQRMKDNDNVFVMNSNYLSEIKEISSNRFNYIAIDN